MLSVILPTYNEQDQIQECLASVYSGHPFEVIVVDGGSDDATGFLAKKAGARVLSSEKGLARQCNLGASSAEGDLLLFLASDTQIEPGFVEAIEDTMTDAGVAFGGFRLRIEDPHPVFRWIEWGGNFRGRLFQFTLPDQGLFVRKKDFEAAGGMDEKSLIPFAGLCERLKEKGRYQSQTLSVSSSARKWRRNGILKTCLNHNLTYLRFRRAEVR